jgi:antitoxin component YwqK of YwqJK toxin-antitoxin module
MKNELETVVMYYENGQKENEGIFKNGKREGFWTEWYENGQQKIVTNYKTRKNGKEDGHWTGWYENGQKMEEGNFKNGKREGFWTYWDENGQKKLEKHYKDGEEEGR